MEINRAKVNEERVSVFLNQSDMERIIIEYISRHTGFAIRDNTTKNIIFSKNDKGTLGFLFEAKITLTNNLNSDDKNGTKSIPQKKEIV